MNIDETIAQARTLRQEDDLEGSQALLLALLEHHPNHPLVLYEVGGAFDVLEEEKAAIPYYQRAIKAGLDGDDLHECLICLGSCQRLTGDFEAAVATLKKAVQQFPDRNSGRVFLALAQYSDAQEDEAVKILLDLLLETTRDEEILTYADTIEYYKENLDDVWDA